MNKKHSVAHLAILYTLLSAGICALLWTHHDKPEPRPMSFPTYTQKAIQPDDHIGSKPFYIFTDNKVPWQALAPRLNDIYGDQVNKKIIGTFPVPHNYKGTDTTNIKTDNENIYFPSYGPFYLHTTVGYFKILLLDPETSEDEKILAIGSFVAGNSVHSLADARKIYPHYKGGPFTTDRLLKTFFAGNQPLKLHCEYISGFLALVLSQLNYRVELVQLHTQDKKNGHIVMQVFLPEKNKLVMIDPDYGAIARDKSGNILSIQKIAVLLREKPDAVFIEDIGNKTWVQDIYDHAEPMPDFSWTPDKSGNVKTAEKESYRQMMKEFTAEYWLHNRNDGKWGRSKKFRWDGARIN